MHYLFFLFPVIFTILVTGKDRYIFRFMATFSCLLILFFAPKSFDWINFDKLIWGSFLFSMVGDYFMGHRNIKRSRRDIYFVTGIIFFLLAHVGYILFMSNYAKWNLYIFIPVFAISTLYYLLRIAPQVTFTPLKIGVFVYFIISAVSLCLSFGLYIPLFNRIFFTLGIISLVFSDSCIAASTFMGHPFPDKLVLPTYYLSHILITLGLIF